MDKRLLTFFSSALLLLLRLELHPCCYRKAIRAEEYSILEKTGKRRQPLVGEDVATSDSTKGISQA
jgi:hypothetical protein